MAEMSEKPHHMCIDASIDRRHFAVRPSPDQRTQVRRLRTPPCELISR